MQSHVNGELRQDALVGEQIGPPPAAIEWLSSIISLEPGDCLIDRDARRLRDVHGPTQVPATGGHGYRLRLRHRRADEPGRPGNGANPTDNVVEGRPSGAAADNRDRRSPIWS